MQANQAQSTAYRLREVSRMNFLNENGVRGWFLKIGGGQI
jgi:hypothetical protein